MTAISRGWTMGKNARPLFGIDWRSLWSEPLAEVQARYRVDPIGQAEIVPLRASQA